MPDYLKTVHVYNLDGTGFRDYTNSVGEVTYHLQDWGGMGSASIEVSATTDTLPMPRYSQVVVRTSSGGPAAYVGVVVSNGKETTGGGLHTVTTQGWGRFWMAAIQPIEQYQNERISDIVKDLLAKYLGPGYPARGKIIYSAGNINTNTITLTDFVLTGNQTLGQVMTQLADVGGFTWGVYSDKKIYFKRQGTSIIKDYRIGQGGLAAPKAYYGPHWNEMTVLGGSVNRWRRFVYIFYKSKDQAKYGRHIHRGVRVPWLRTPADGRRYAEKFLARYTAQNVKWEFEARKESADFLPKIHDGRIRLRGLTGANNMTAAAVEMTVTLGDDYSIQYDFGRGDERLASISNEMATNEQYLQSSDSARPVDLDGREDPGGDGGLGTGVGGDLDLEDVNIDPRDTDESDYPVNSWANPVSQAADAFNTVVDEIEREKTDSSYGEEATTATHLQALKALAAILGNDNVDTEAFANFFDAMQRRFNDLLDSDDVSNLLAGDTLDIIEKALDQLKTSSIASVREEAGNFLEKLDTVRETLMTGTNLPASSQESLGNSILDGVSAALENVNTSQAAKDRLIAALRVGDIAAIAAAINSGNVPIYNIALVIADGETSTPIWNNQAGDDVVTSIDDVQAIRVDKTAGNLVT